MYQESNLVDDTYTLDYHDLHYDHNNLKHFKTENFTYSSVILLYFHKIHFMWSFYLFSKDISYTFTSAQVREAKREDSERDMEEQNVTGNTLVDEMSFLNNHSSTGRIAQDYQVKT